MDDLTVFKTIANVADTKYHIITTFTVRRSRSITQQVIYPANAFSGVARKSGWGLFPSPLYCPPLLPAAKRFLVAYILSIILTEIGYKIKFRIPKLEF